MAANLLYLKSRSLLPVDLQPPDEEVEDDDPRWDLIRQLIEYKKFKEAAAQLQDRARQQENIFARTGIGPLTPESPLRLGEVGIFQLINAFQNVIKRVEARQELQEIFGENFTVSDKIEAILARVSEGATLKFSDLFAKMVSLFGRRGTMEIAIVMGDYAMTAMVLNAVDQRLPPGRESLLPPPK